MQFIRKQEVVQAIQYKSYNFDEICDFLGTTPVPVINPDFGVDENGNTNEPYLGFTVTNKYVVKAVLGDFIVKYDNGDFYICSEEDFNNCFSSFSEGHKAEDITGSFGISVIQKERRRQILEEGFSTKSDAENYPCGELADAAACYVMRDYWRKFERNPSFHIMWPWEANWWKPTPEDRIKELAKAGALIAAEIDRLSF